MNNSLKLWILLIHKIWHPIDHYFQVIDYMNQYAHLEETESKYWRSLMKKVGKVNLNSPSDFGLMIVHASQAIYPLKKRSFHLKGNGRHEYHPRIMGDDHMSEDECATKNTARIKQAKNHHFYIDGQLEKDQYLDHRTKIIILVQALMDGLLSGQNKYHRKN